MTLSEVCFWLLVASVAYPYAIYPLLLLLAAQFQPRRTQPYRPVPSSFSLVIAAHNEGARIQRRLRELLTLVNASGHRGEVILVSDGSTDETVSLARPFVKEGLHILELPVRQGKAVALNRGCAAASHDILVFADVRQTWEPAALEQLLRHFADPEVGAVSGDLVLESSPGVMAAVGLYWRYEKWLRKLESRVHSTVGVTGAIAAVRRRLFPNIPEGTLLDDVYWPLQTVMLGYRVIHEDRARAHDRLPERPRDEFRRKVRTLCGNFQLMALLPGTLFPWRNPIWFQFLSHKLLRLAVPWALLGMLILSLLSSGSVYQFLFGTQVVCYLLAVWGLWMGARARLRIAEAAAAFLVLNSAAWLAFWVWISGQATQSWQKVAYQAISVTHGATERPTAAEMGGASDSHRQRFAQAGEGWIIS